MKMLSAKKRAMGALAFLFAGMLIGCEPKGPAEQAGEKIDNAGRSLEDAVDPRGPAQKAGDAIDKAVGNK